MIAGGGCNHDWLGFHPLPLAVDRKTVKIALDKAENND
jgi:hypothetical protein